MPQRGAGPGPLGTVAPTPGPVTPGALTDASWDDIISAVAKQHGVNPALALAVAKRESRVNPTAIGDGGKAVGMFQLHAGAAQDTNVDRSDPLQNITGGVKYLRQLSDRYQGDLTKTLQAYNGGLDNVDKGIVSTDAQLYASEVLGSLRAPMMQQAGRASGAGPSGQVVAGQQQPVKAQVEPPPMPDLIEGIKRGLDPRTPEGRLNLTTGAGAAAAAYFTGGVSVLPWIARALAPAAGATAAAMMETTAENVAGTSAADPITTGLTQGTIELVTPVVLWPFRTIAKSLLAPTVARSAKEALRHGLDAATTAGRAQVDVARTASQDMIDAANLFKTATVEAAQIDARAMTRAAGTRARDVRAALDLRNAEIVADVTKEYDTLVGRPPSILGTGKLAKDVVSGPAKHALDLAGARVEEAAKTGPMINLTGIQQQLRTMFERAKPSSVFAEVDEATADAIGFLSKLPAGAQRSVAAQLGGGESLQAGVAKAFGLPESHPLPGILGKLQAAPESITFSEAHAIKRLLDESVIWDRAAKKHVEQITKGIRIALREQMSGHAPYDIATSAYESIVPLYRRGVGKAFIRAAEHDPDRIASMLTAGSPARAQALRDLLVQQSAAGGDPALGQRAWNAVRGHYTYKNLVTKNGKPDPTGVSERVATMINQSPEFARIVFGAADGQVYLSNLTSIGDAVLKATTQQAEQAAIAKVGTRQGLDVVKEAATQAVAAARQRGAAATTTAGRQGAEGIRTARATAQAGVTAAKEQLDEFGKTKVAKFATPEKFTSLAGDVLRASTLGPASTWGGLSILRLLNAPSGAELMYWAALSPQRTQRMIQALLSPVGDRASAMFVRDVYSAIQGGQGTQSPADAPAAAAQPLAQQPALQPAAAAR